MSKKREFGEGPIYTATNYIMWFFLGNFYFLICNIPLLFVIFSFSGEFINEYLVLLVLSALPVGPAYTALLSTMGKLVREKDINTTKDYFSAYKTNFLQSLFVWTLQVVLIIILIIDMRFFASKGYGRIAIPVVYSLIAIILATSIYVYSIISRFYLKTKDIVKLSLYFLVSKWKITISCISVFIISYGIAYKFASIGSLFIVSLACYSIMFLQKDVLKDMEEKLKEKQLVEA
ncbi:DUF624 domain-containing protein [Clostridium swellfunianum]|uniref:YesL family protein n=1 Tax=Clostridium swellfunianum TaxID=1367462 RepID=UPI00202DB85B|nr:DUF624 domain-containing protein [Clostridium swellfunianum]MCM0647113.1 DUF624 domain-containing protein [Clostridium swellfunianum]